MGRPGFFFGKARQGAAFPGFPHRCIAANIHAHVLRLIVPVCARNLVLSAPVTSLFRYVASLVRACFPVRCDGAWRW